MIIINLKEKLSRKKVILSLFGLVLIFLVLFFIKNNKNNIPPITVKKHAKSKCIFDIHSLIGKNVYEVSKILGSPVSKESIKHQAGLGIPEWVLNFKKDGNELFVTYKVKTKKVCEYYLAFDESSGLTKDRDYLIEIANLKVGDPRYKIRYPRSIKKPTHYVGVRVIPVE